MADTPTHSPTLAYEGKDLESMDLANNYHQWILDHFQPYVGDHLLEVGAGRGSVSRLLLDRFQKKMTLLEPSDGMRTILEHSTWLEKYPETKILGGFLADHAATLSSQNIDSIFYINVLEHIPDDTRELEIVREILPSGGHVLTFSPALMSLYGPLDKRIGHFRRYHKNQINDLMKNAGLEVVRSTYIDIVGMFGWWLTYRLLKSSNLNPKMVQRFDRYIAPVMRRIEPSSILPLGKNVLVIARKP